MVGKICSSGQSRRCIYKEIKEAHQLLLKDCTGESYSRQTAECSFPNRKRPQLKLVTVLNLPIFSTLPLLTLTAPRLSGGWKHSYLTAHGSLEEFSRKIVKKIILVNTLNSVTEDSHHQELLHFVEHIRLKSTLELI